MKLGSRSSLVIILAVVVLLLFGAVPSNSQDFLESNGTYTTSQTSSCFKNDYSKWGSDRSLAIGVSPAVFKVGRNGSPDACGVTMELRCLGPSGNCVSGKPLLKVTVVDECKTCDDRTIRLTLSAYRTIAAVDTDGVILGYRYL